jgi:hypothetical protein
MPMTDVLNNILKAKFVMMTVDLIVHVQVVPFPQGHGLVFLVTKPPIPSYAKEATMFGKTIRLLIHIQNNYGLMGKLKTHELRNVTVTEMKAPHLVNKGNTTTLTYDYLVEFFVALQTSTFLGIEEASIKAVINENSHL